MSETSDNTFECVVCGGVFEKGWTEEEALSELSETFPGIPQDECSVVCDDCYKRMVGV